MLPTGALQRAGNIPTEYVLTICDRGPNRRDAWIVYQYPRGFRGPVCADASPYSLPLSLAWPMIRWSSSGQDLGQVLGLAWPMTRSSRPHPPSSAGLEVSRCSLLEQTHACTGVGSRHNPRPTPPYRSGAVGGYVPLKGRVGQTTDGQARVFRRIPEPFSKLTHGVTVRRATSAGGCHAAQIDYSIICWIIDK
jgi:hypothetical protein